MSVRTISKNKASFALLVCFALVGFFHMRGLPLVLYGDGKEYAMQAVAFQRHLSFGITVEDIKQAEKDFARIAKPIAHEYYVNPKKHMHEYGNAKYCNHYGSYSALVGLVKYFTDLLGLDSVLAFFITNYLLYLSALLVVFFVLKENGIQKFTLTLLTGVNPAAFYLGWAHSEIYLYSFTVIGLVFYYNRQFARSIFFLSVAAMQNLGVIPFALMVGVDLLIDEMRNRRRPDGKFDLWGFLRSAVPYGLCYIPAILPIISTLIKFHTVNLVADVAMENKYLLHKAFDYLFDLNLGIFPYEPIILLLFIAMSACGIVKYPRRTLINLIGVAGMLYVVAHQRQINCGMQNIMRYNVWILPALIFFVVLNWNHIWNREKMLLAVGIAEALITLSVILYIIKGSGDFSSDQFAPWTKFVMNHWPSLYNPSHGIFYSRVLQRESYFPKIPVSYVTEEGITRKILLNKESEEVFASDECTLFNEKGEPVRKRDLPRFSIDEGDFWYLNFTKPVYYVNSYRPGDPIVFQAEGYNADRYVMMGMAHPEDWGTWSNGDRLLIAMDVGKAKAPFLMAHLLTGGGFHHPQRTSIFVQGEEVWKGMVGGQTEIVFPVRPKSKDFVLIECLFPDAARPCDVMQSGDRRKLGIQLISMVVDEVTPDYPDLPANGVISFHSGDYNAEKYIVYGVSLEEEPGSWTDGLMSLLTFSANGDAENLPVRMKVTGVLNSIQRTVISVNGDIVFNGEVTPQASSIDFDIQRAKDGKYCMRIEIPNAISPNELNISKDMRLLGIRIHSIAVGQ